MNDRNPREAPCMTYLAVPVLASEVAIFLGGRLSGKDLRLVGVATYGARIRHSISYQVEAEAAEDVVERVVVCSEHSAESISASTKIIVKDARAEFMRFLGNSQADWEKTVCHQAELAGISAGRYRAHRTAFVAEGTVIGSGVEIEPGAIVMEGAIIGSETLISAGAVLAAHGPAVHRKTNGEKMSWGKIHYGTLRLGEKCEVGCRDVILRGMLGSTQVGADVILGNMVHIGHGAKVDGDVWMAAAVTVCGHAVIGHRASIGAGATIRDNVKVGARASVGMGSVVVDDVAPDSHVRGVPARAVATKRSPKAAR